MTTSGIRKVKTDYWRARDLIGAKEASRIWEDAGADHDEELEYEIGVGEPKIISPPDDE